MPQVATPERAVGGKQERGEREREGSSAQKLTVGEVRTERVSVESDAAENPFSAAFLDGLVSPSTYPRKRPPIHE